MVLKEELISLINLKDLIQKDIVNVGCVGLYNHGKSSLLNMIVGDVEEKTFKVADVRETVENKRFEKDNIIYVDTPGLNAKLDDNKKVMETILNFDVILFVHSLTTGELNQKEVEFLESIKHYWKSDRDFVKKIIFVLTRKDKLSNEEIKKVKSKIKKQITNIFDANEINIIDVSSLDYKEGIIEKEEELIEESNIEKLKDMINLVINMNKDNIKNERLEKFEKLYSKLYNQIAKQIEIKEKELQKLKEEEQKFYNNLENEINDIERTLKNMYERL